jgi:hypothetical protein
MSKTIDIQLAFRWEEYGNWKSYDSTFSKKLAAKKFRVFCDSKIPGLPVSMNLAKARSFAAHHGGEVVEVYKTASGWVGGNNKDEAESFHLYYNENHSAPEADERHIGYVIRIPASSLVYAKLQGHIEGLEISDNAKNRYVYRLNGTDHYVRINEDDHTRHQAGKSGVYSQADYTFVRYIPRSTEGGAA